MPHDLLDGAGVGASFQTVGGIAVAQLMTENRNPELAPCIFDGPLRIGLMHPGADLDPLPRAAAGGAGKPTPIPHPAVRSGA